MPHEEIAITDLTAAQVAELLQTIQANPEHALNADRFNLDIRARREVTTRQMAMRALLYGEDMTEYQEVTIPAALVPADRTKWGSEEFSQYAENVFDSDLWKGRGRLPRNERMRLEDQVHDIVDRHKAHQERSSDQESDPGIESYSDRYGPDSWPPSAA